MERRIYMRQSQKIRKPNLFLHGKRRKGNIFHILSVSSSLFHSLLLLSTVSAAERKLDKDELPSFLEPVANVTVAVGRAAFLSCVVDNLGQHKVAWVHLDRQMIVAIHKLVVSRQQRFSVTHDSHKTWTLHVNRVIEKDRGYYMCQVNTTPMISQKGYLQVVVPPNIRDEFSSGSNILSRERDNVTLKCEADGFPLPQIRWRREDGRSILALNGREVYEVEGEILSLSSVTRESMGSYFCIASNGVPPSVSKRITLEVEFPPKMHVPNQLVGVPVGNEISLECQVEASPRPVTYWSHEGTIISNSTRIYSHAIRDNYRYKMLLIIRDIRDEDFGQYTCVAKNSFSEINGSIKLNKVARPTRPSTFIFPDRRLNFDEFPANKRRSEDNDHSKESDIENVSLHKVPSPSTYEDTLSQHTSDPKEIYPRKDGGIDRTNRKFSFKPIDEFGISKAPAGARNEPSGITIRSIPLLRVAAIIFLSLLL